MLKPQVYILQEIVLSPLTVLFNPIVRLSGPSRNWGKASRSGRGGSIVLPLLREQTSIALEMRCYTERILLMAQVFLLMEEPYFQQLMKTSYSQ